LDKRFQMMECVCRHAQGWRHLIGTHIARKTTYCVQAFAPVRLIADTASPTNHAMKNQQ
jgi:hypothetical protein